MIEKVLPLQFLKKSPFFGSWKEMNYRISKQEEELEFCAYPGPYAFDHTPEEKKTYRSFEFSDEGYEQGLRFLNEYYEQLPGMQKG